VGLLDQLRADDSGSRSHNEKWQELPSLLTDAIPEYKHGKTVLIRGEVIVIGSIKTPSLSRHLYAVLHSERSAANPVESKNVPKVGLLPPQRPGRARPAVMGISRYRAEAETNYYSDPWVEWVEPEPEPFVGWIVGIMTTTTEDTPYLEEKRRNR
jgi:hypothetical protein